MVATAKMTPEAMLALLNNLPAPVLRSYSGRPGCGCGCNGKYTDNPSTATVNRQVRAMKEVVIMDPEARFGFDADAEIPVVFVEGDRFRWLYLARA